MDKINQKLKWLSGYGNLAISKDLIKNWIEGGKNNG